MDLQASTGNIIIEDGNTDVPSSMVVDTQKPVKKPTRQWAAWTRQEEENFFSALRQVGKNFEKITCRVQSKNKDQVRHYYYRLVRRMNKLLGPGFSLDAKNSKDTIAAMLRWWSLLEKYSCTASKLHLKPRRFKTFIEALAHQLLKDRNKSRRKRPPHEEHYSFIPSTSSSILTKASGTDIHPVKLLFLDNQKIQKVGCTKSAPLKGSSHTSINCHKVGISTAKPMKPNRRTGLIASAAYRRWEKAAVAGVSLVADAAEQLERTNSDRNDCSDQTTFNILPVEDCAQEDTDVVGNVAHPLFSPTSDRIFSYHIGESCVQPSMKLKLQLFPVDDATRKVLEKENHNPYLELTLSARKRISSILEHLNRKWGKSSAAAGELVLFPYDIYVDDLVNCQRWTVRDKIFCAADVYGTVGKPEIFRLRYGWLSNSEPVSRIVQLPLSTTSVACGTQPKESSEGNADGAAPNGITMWVDLQKDNSDVEHVLLSSSGVHDTEAVSCHLKPKNTSLEPLQLSFTLSFPDSRNQNEQQEHEEKHRSSKTSILSAGEWADSLTNISIGELLSEASRAADSVSIHPPDDVIAPSSQNVPFGCDSFDAAIAAHISRYKDTQSNRIFHASVWDAEETCDEFSFNKMSSYSREDKICSFEVSNETCHQIVHKDAPGFCGFLKNVTETEPSDGIFESMQEMKSEPDKEHYHSKHETETNFGITDVYWPDSLGALDLEFPSSSRYLSQDMILGDSGSQNGLGRLISSSLDAFQNLSFCISEKKMPSAGEV